MNEKASVTLYALMLTLVVIILALALAPAVSEFTETARNESTSNTLGMNCSNPNLSDANRAACVATDLTFFYFVSGLIFIAGAIATARVMFG